MSLLTVASPVICSRVEFAFGADLTAPAESWDWTEMGDYVAEGRTRPRLLNQTLEITSGRQNESNLADPSQISVTLGNGDGELTPYNPASSLYPGITRGTPCRVSVQAGLPHLVFTGFTGSRARTPDAVALDIVNDLAGAVEFVGPVVMPPYGGAYTVSAKYETTGNQRSWLFALNANGIPVFRWSNDGTTLHDVGTTLPLPVPEAGPVTIGWELDVSNAGNHVVTWYYRRGTLDELLANLAESVFGDPFVGSGTTSVFSSSAPLDVGHVTTLDDGTGYPGRINRVQVRAGNLSTGTIAADLNATELAPGATGVTDSAGRVWSFSDAEVTNWRPRFCGRVTSVDAEWEVVDEANPLMPTLAYVNVEAAGILERLNQADALESALTRHLSSDINKSAVVACWPFEDGREATQAAQLVHGAAPMSIRGTYTFGGDTTYSASLQQMTVGSGDVAYMTAPIPAIPQVPGVNWQVTRFMRIDDPTTASPGTQVMAVDTNGSVATWRVNINDAQLTLTGVDADGAGVVLTTVASATEWFGNEIQVILEIADDGVNVDWAVRLIPLPSGLVYQTSGTFAGDTGVPYRFRNNVVGPPEGIALGHLIITTDRVVGWLARVDAAYAGEVAPQRVFRLCQEEGIPIAVNGAYGLDVDAAVLAGAERMGPQRPRKLLDLLDEAAEVDHGILYEQRGSLGLTYRSGSSLLNQSTRLSLSRAQRQVVEPFSLVDDDLRTVNDVTAERPDGSSARVEDPRIATGEAERYQRSIETNVYVDEQLPAQAGWRYHLGTWTEPHFPQVRTDIAKDADLVETALGFGVGDRLELTDPLPGCPPVDQLADGLVEELERFQWRLAVIGRPARPWDTAIVDDDMQGRVDNSSSVTTTAITVGVTTSVTVASTYGTWTTTEEPFDVAIDGVRFRVTAVTGATSPQTFTITATPINGDDIDRIIASGADVKLWQPAVIAP